MSSTPRKASVFQRLYVGNGAFDIVGKRTRWYGIFGAILVASVLLVIFKGFNLGIDFTGGTRIQMPAQTGEGTSISQEAVQDSFKKSVGEDATSVQTVGTGDAATFQIRSETLTTQQIDGLKNTLNDDLKPEGGLSSVSDSAVSASWGGEITTKALLALLIFFVAVMLFLALYFELAMAVGALVAVVHDVVITAGVYSLVGFEVSPATIIGLLTILGFSLYDTVVVFDKVRENTRGILGLTRRTYGEATNLAVNQTLMRSINTSLIALLPVMGLLVVGVWLLGVGTLKDLALVQLAGMAIGALSSIFIAPAIAVDLKMRDPRYKAQAARVKARRDNVARKNAVGAVSEDEVESTDEDSLEAELRKEKAFTAAAGVPARHAKAADARRTNRPTGKKQR
ncbi:protein translocase subunit SecF [Actinosynnema pretiosum subsp. pretiosum]|uniref:Protein-export membrane protein SecF n=2 Tax=Actinosynnema TaxID=40566 RepID=C6WCM8_ACTMD|nr:protein translocase subunit SecF [Actinosynnema mirum]ACU35645.1 protein-export membrane protein SecF [Actinosynnema mirum DSM 43827]AXX29075.1 Protein-export membrane protein SecF [Actinosynnema pretiosum subsp. pretiosum]QUF06650.1 protein translocase subunit SecF [Actinosynnema pretiosum subsp. pretiosum]